MDTTEINKDQLLQKLRENRELHAMEFTKAMKTWRKQATKALKKAAKKAEDEGEITLHPLTDLPKPQHFLDSYDQAIAKLEYEVKDSVEVDDRQFAAWVLDNWQWRHEFIAGTSLYNAA